jgi:hypothetical protein
VPELFASPKEPSIAATRNVANEHHLLGGQASRPFLQHALQRRHGIAGLALQHPEPALEEKSPDHVIHHRVPQGCLIGEVVVQRPFGHPGIGEKVVFLFAWA